jgi:hypothetical protein
MKERFVFELHDHAISPQVALALFKSKVVEAAMKFERRLKGVSDFGFVAGQMESPLKFLQKLGDFGVARPHQGVHQIRAVVRLICA